MPGIAPAKPHRCPCICCVARNLVDMDMDSSSGRRRSKAALGDVNPGAAAAAQDRILDGAGVAVCAGLRRGGEPRPLRLGNCRLRPQRQRHAAAAH